MVRLIVKGRPARTWLTSIAPREPPGADAHEGDAVAVVGIHVRLDLEDEAREAVAVGIDRPVRALAGTGRRREVDEAIEERLDAEVGHRAAEEDGGERAGQELVVVERGARRVEEGDLVQQLLVTALAQRRRARSGSSRPQVHAGACAHRPPRARNGAPRGARDRRRRGTPDRSRSAS